MLDPCHFDAEAAHCAVICDFENADNVEVKPVVDAPRHAPETSGGWRGCGERITEDWADATPAIRAWCLFAFSAVVRGHEANNGLSPLVIVASGSIAWIPADLPSPWPTPRASLKRRYGAGRYRQRRYFLRRRRTLAVTRPWRAAPIARRRGD